MSRTERIQTPAASILAMHRYCAAFVRQLNGRVCMDIKFKMNDNLIRSLLAMLMVCGCNYGTNATGNNMCCSCH